MKLSEQLNQNLIQLKLSGKSKYQVIEDMVNFIYKNEPSIDKDIVLRDVIEREQYLSTGLENGLAVPHGKTTGTKRLIICLGICKEGIDFDSLDGKLSQIIFLLISPKDTSGPHIQALAQIARDLKNKTVRDRLIKAENADQIIDIFRETEQN
ncbi:MAG: PTS sugar transporter subunit IIA [Calditrichaeota bacterium]|nr:PTS sugar transporter subunit IIA [Calditrichota bacterium]